MTATPYLGQSTDIILGQDFLTWIWFRSETQRTFKLEGGDLFAVNMGPRVTVQGGEGEATETATVSGTFSELDEARAGLKKGKKVTCTMLIFEREPELWKMKLSAGDFTICGLKTPKIEKTKTYDDPDAAFFERMYLIEMSANMVNAAFAEFIELRFDSEKWREEIESIKTWIQEA